MGLVAAVLLALGVVLAGLASTMAAPPREALPPERHATIVAQATSKALGEASLAVQEATAVAKAEEMNRLRPDRLLTPPVFNTPAPTPTIAIRGLYDRPRHPHFYHDYLTNGWNGYIQGQYYEVLAGAYYMHRDRGFIGVAQGDWRTGKGVSAKYETPRAVGPVTITAVSPSYQFTLRAEDGTIFVFDLPSRRYISGPGVPPAGTPAPAAPGAPTPTPAGPRPTSPTPRAP